MMYRLRVPKKIYFKRGSMPVALRELSEIYGMKSALLVTENDLYKQRLTKPIIDILTKQGIRTAEFIDIGEEATFEAVYNSLPKMLEFRPEVIIGVGGGAALSMAKLMWLLFENPEMDLEKTVAELSSLPEEEAGTPLTGQKAKLVLAPTEFGAGAECSPFATAKDAAGKAHTICTYDLLPEMAVIDADYTGTVSDEIAIEGGKTALVKAIEVCLCEGVSGYTMGFAGDAVRLVLENLPLITQKDGTGARAKELLITASALAGLAMANSMEVPKIEEDIDGRLRQYLEEPMKEVAHVAGFVGTDAKVSKDFKAAVENILAL